MHCLCCLSLLSLDLGLCHGFLLSLLPCVGLPSGLLRHGGLLLRSGGLLLRRGGLLLRSGGLLLQSGGPLLRRGGLLLYRGERLLRPGGLTSHLLHPGGLLLRLLRPGVLLLCLLRPGGLTSHPLCPGGLLLRLLRRGGPLFCRPCAGLWLHPGFLLCRFCLGPRPLHFHVDLTLRALGLLHYTNCCTSPKTTFPLIHCTDDTQLITLITQLITQSHTLYKSWTTSLWSPSIV